MDSISPLLKLSTIIFLAIRVIYWEYASWRDNKVVPKISSGVKSIGAYLSDIPLTLFIIVQLVGFAILPMPKNIVLQILGFVMVAFSVWLSFKARKDIHTNWTHAGEYQIKRNQTLTTHGIYAFIRHPIYLSFTLSYVGAELVAQSWLFVSCFAFFIASYLQAKREEKILLAHFGEKYKDYMRKTKMLIPFVL